MYQYIPTNDFRNYYEFGWEFIHNASNGISRAIKTYGMPEMGGVAVLYGVISWLFNGKVTGFVFANSIMASCISVIIYSIGKHYSKESGIAGALLWAIYPMNIISSQITTNHHGAILFTLLGICFFDKQYRTENRRNYYAIMSGICLVISQLWHASIIIPILAICCYGIMRCLEYKNDKKMLRLSLKALIKAIAVFLIVSNLCFYFITHVADCEQISTDFLYKIYVGMNKETNGTYSQSDWEQVHINGAELTPVLIEERFKSYDISDFIMLLRNKMELMWFDIDSYAGYWIDAEAQDYYHKLNENELSEQEKQNYESGFAAVRDIELLDKIFVNMLYVCMFFGVIWRKREQGSIIDCVIWFILGWIGVHLFIEVQARYRYLAMPYVFIMAAIGLTEGVNKGKVILKKIK